MELNGKIAVVTGSAHGIGAATCRALGEHGATVIATSVDDKSGRALAQEIQAEYEHLNVTSYPEWEDVLAKVVARHGRLDILICNAGVMTRSVSQAFLDDNIEEWLKPDFYHRIRSINLDGVVYGIIAAIPYFKANGGGSIAITGSFAGVQPQPTDPFYAATKHAVNGLAQSLGPGLKALNIAVSTICPGGIDTRLIPSDLREMRKSKPPFLSQPAYAAKAILDVIIAGATGDVWIAPADPVPPWRYQYTPIQRG